MRKLLNTLFVLTPDAYLSLQNDNIQVNKDDEKPFSLPLHNVESILYFGYKGASPALMGYCAENAIRLCFLTPHGRFLAAVSGENKGNVLLRKEQYRRSDDESRSVLIARNFIFGKIYNSRQVLNRFLRDHPTRVDGTHLRLASENLLARMDTVHDCSDFNELLGLEGTAAVQYFGCFDQLILSEKESFFFRQRSRRPPTDRTNALLSFAYTLLANDCSAALESVGLDPYVGFFHRDRPGRTSLALDLMEELRSSFADRFVLSLINNRIVSANDFVEKENGAYKLNEDARKSFLSKWQEKKKEMITHPFTQEKIEWGLVPYVQALLLARFLRGDLDGYPPFLWK